MERWGRDDEVQGEVGHRAAFVEFQEWMLIWSLMWEAAEVIKLCSEGAGHVSGVDRTLTHNTCSNAHVCGMLLCSPQLYVPCNHTSCFCQMLYLPESHMWFVVCGAERGL